MLEQVSKKFSELLKNEIGEENMDLLKYRNSVREFRHVCHSHDFCDANLLMLSAIESVVGEKFDNTDSDQELLWANAWNVAKANSFYI